ncbi:hypothetical protein RMSM_06010 [Rhodopirellula maiorica SM1]|uniref:Uncharacterized protein n=1 Tax=Rhodopirellula maiorica SM1 TaxID=1265738 RepID=M5RCF6_9BACT|nr:hypothetical protein RMSM_06010 [Rhodopirellula maiorica SM1]
MLCLESIDDESIARAGEYRIRCRIGSAESDRSMLDTVAPCENPPIEISAFG